MFYGNGMIKDKEGCMWAVIALTMHGLVVETIKNSKTLRGLVNLNDARAYSDGHMKYVEVRK